MENRVTILQLLDGYRAGRLSRRDLLIQATAIGFSASALGQLLAREAAAVPAVQDEPVAGGTLREGYDLDFSKLDPVSTDWYDPAFHALYDSLLIDAPDGTLQPNLAESWEVSEDGKTVTFVLKEGGLFHSGRPLPQGQSKRFTTPSWTRRTGRRFLPSSHPWNQSRQLMSARSCSTCHTPTTKFSTS